MTDKAQDRLRRLLHLLPRIADGQDHLVDEVAKQLGVTRALLLADLQLLSQRFNDPGGFIESVSFAFDDKYITATTQAFRRPMRLTVAELCALELGLAVLRVERPENERDAIDRARVRLRKVIAKMPREQIPDGLRHAVLGDIGKPAHLAAVRRALREKQKLKIVYHGGSSAKRTARTICPYSLAAANGMMYVVAYCEESAAMRIFRLDRMEEVKLSGASFQVPGDYSLSKVMQDGKLFVTEKPPAAMTVKYSARIARWIAEREEKTVAPDGTLTMVHPLADRAWAVRHVLQYGADAEVLEPVEVRREVARRLRELRTAVG